MKQRKTFQGTGWESLEGRQLLSAGGGLLQARLAHRAALASAQAARAAAQFSTGSASTQYRILKNNTAVGTAARALRVSTPEKGTTAQSGGVSSGTANSNVSTPGTSAGTKAAQTSSGYYGLPAGNYVATRQGGSGSGTRTPTSQGASANIIAATTGVQTTTSGTTTFLLTRAPGTTTTTSSGSTASSSPAMPPAFLPGLTSGVTLSKGDVAGLKSAVDTFASAYTYGTDATKDRAASVALQSSLDDLALTTWTQSHVLPATSVAQLKQAVDAFAATYTSGATVATDKAAYRALQTSLAQVSSGVAGSATTTASVAPMPGPLMMPPVGVAGSSTSTGFLGGVSLTRDDVTALKKAVTDFATAYTSGTNATADSTAATALQTSLGTLASTVWQRTGGITPA